ncbi:copper resistance protein NlpE [Campylobacter sp.]|uniref:copper resistance protein NlpE n=1 Tax=Campylobacter sp. TaxID=205 RepID=UPI003F9FB7CB
MKNFIFALSAALLLAGCATSSQNTSIPQGKCEVKSSCTAAQTSIEGTYKAFLPCASCMGIDSTLTLKKDGTFVSVMDYKSKDNYKAMSKGKYSIENGVITTVDEYKEKNFYKIEGENLKMLDMDQKEVTGELKDKYIFKRVK